MTHPPLHPLDYTSGAGAQSGWVVPLLWESLIVSIVVVLIIAALLVAGVLRRKSGRGITELRLVPLSWQRGGARWIWIGCAISLVPLLVSLVWTVTVLAAAGPLPRHPDLIIDVTAKQWWWDASYAGPTSDQRFRTANELHVPVGKTVLLRLQSADVIHSFWVPKLAGKTDVIPGQTNLMWIKADAPGRYRGQCGEFCGFQHAHMAFEVVADSPADFVAWYRDQMREAPAPQTPAQARGLAYVEYRCSLCHAVRGTNAGASVAPDLTHLMSRRWIAAGTLPNNPAALSGWIEDPQSAKPGALMPAQALSAQQLSDVRAYLETLQ